jgi:hypothetical protein
MGAWLDLASLVTSGAKAPGISDFAREVGSDIFVDVAGWHLVRAAARCSRRHDSTRRNECAALSCRRSRFTLLAPSSCAT